jgi:heptosyltransferase-1
VNKNEATSIRPTIQLGERPRILLVRLSAIGDVVVATPVIRRLRSAFPAAYLAWLAEEKAFGIVEGNPGLDEVIVWPRERWTREGGRSPASRARSLGQHLRFARGLRERSFDVAIDFQGLLRSALIVRASGAAWRVASEGTKEGSAHFYNVRVPRGDDRSSRQRCLDLLRPLGIETSDRRMDVWFSAEDAAAANALRARAECAYGARGAQRPLVCLCPATTWRHKHWREEGWAVVADGLVRDGAIPVFMGAAGDRPLLERIRAQMRAPAYLAAGETSLKEAAALLSLGRLSISVDTGLMHVAVAVGTPVVALCGPSYWPGFQDYERFHMIRKPFPCSPCLRHPICGNDDCMTAITPEEVLGRARAMLSGLQIVECRV